MQIELDNQRVATIYSASGLLIKYNNYFLKVSALIFLHVGCVK